MNFAEECAKIAADVCAKREGVFKEELDRVKNIIKDYAKEGRIEAIIKPSKDIFLEFLAQALKNEGFNVVIHNFGQQLIVKW